MAADRQQQTAAASILVAFTLALFGILEADALTVKLLCAAAVVPLTFCIARLTGQQSAKGTYQPDFSMLDRLAAIQGTGARALAPVRVSRVKADAKGQIDSRRVA